MCHGARREQDGHRSGLTHAQSDRHARGSKRCGCGGKKEEDKKDDLRKP